MRKRNAVLNLIFSIVYYIINIILGFAIRKIFLITLDTEYLGILSVFTDILGVLAALDCGISSTLFLNIYKPLEDQDERHISSVFSMVRVVYVIRGIVICIVGALLCFFFPFLFHSSQMDLTYIQKCYFMYLVVSSFNYTAIFYAFFLEAAQKKYLAAIVQAAAYIFSSVLQILNLIYIKSFFWYLFLTAFNGIASSYLCKFIVYRKYPYLRKRTKILDEDRKDMKNMFKMVVHSASGVLAKYTDSLLITGLVGVAANGLYSNYKMLITKVNELLNQLTASLKDPMRSLMVSGDKKQIYSMLKNITFLYAWAAGICSICLVVLLNPMISLVFGSQYIIEPWGVVLTVTAMYLSVVNYAVVDGYYCAKCFIRDKKSPIIEVVTNLVLSFILGRYIGIAGIMLGTVVYYGIQTILRSRKLLKNYWGISEKEYLFKLLQYTLVIIACGVFTWFCAIHISLGNKYMEFVVKGAFSFALPNIMLFIIYRKNNEFSYFKQIIYAKINKIKSAKKIDG